MILIYEICSANVNLKSINTVHITKIVASYQKDNIFRRSLHVFRSTFEADIVK